MANIAKKTKDTVEKIRAKIRGNNSNTDTSPKSAEVIDNQSIQYVPISPERLASFYEFKGITKIINEVKSLGYEVKPEDEKSIFDYVLANPDTKKEGYIDELIKSLHLTELKQVIASKLFQEKNITKTSSSLVADTLYSFCVGKSVSRKKISKSLDIVSNTYTTGKIELLLQLVEETLSTEFGEDTFKVFISLVSYWYNTNNRSNTVTVSGSDILEYLNKKYEKTDKNTKRIKKIYNLQWLTEQVRLLEIIKVYSTGITPKNGDRFTLDEYPLLEISKISYYPSNIDIYGNYDLSNVTDLHITFKVGEWFNYFDSPKYCTQFTYVHQKALSSGGMLSNFLNWIPIATRQNQKGNFTVKYILESIGEKETLNEILTTKGSSYKTKDLFNSFNRIIKEAQSIEDLPQSIVYELPQWESRKPHGWFTTWLNQNLIIKDNQYLKAIEPKKENSKKEDTPKKTIEDLKQLMTDTKISIRALADSSSYTFYRIQSGLKNKNLKEFELKDLINHCYIVNQKKKNK